MPDAKTASAKTYRGGCHCGRVRYQATSDLAQVVDCNCSICIKRGAIWAFVKPPQFKLVQGGDALTDYQFGKKQIHHRSASRVHRLVLAWAALNGDETFAINVNCLDGVDVATLKLTPFDGKNM